MAPELDKEKLDRFPVLFPGQSALTERVRSLLSALGEPGREGLRFLDEGLLRLTGMWQAIDQFPSVYSEESLGRRRRSFQTLVETFANINPFVTEAYLPTRAVLGRGFAMASFNFCRMLGVLVEEFLGHADEVAELRTLVDDVMRGSICALIAEDLLMSVASDERLEGKLRRKAAGLLAALWEERKGGEISRFADLLTSIWNAKARITINYGTLAGVTELFGLARAGCDPEFISYFCRDDVPAEEHAAFMEFVFNATFEEMEVMRRYMREHDVKALDAEDVARIFNVPLSRLHRTIHTAQDFFFTFRERQIMASQRLMRNLPGPKKTAEEYVMIFFLRQMVERAGSPGEKEVAAYPAGKSL